MFKVDKADSGFSRVCRDLAEYALIAALLLAVWQTVYWECMVKLGATS